MTPRGGRAAIEGIITDADGAPLLSVRVTEAASDGKATRAALALIARAADMPRTSVRLIAGATSRVKRVHIAGDAENIAASLEAAVSRTR